MEIKVNKKIIGKNIKELTLDMKNAHMNLYDGQLVRLVRRFPLSDIFRVIPLDGTVADLKYTSTSYIALSVQMGAKIVDTKYYL